MRRRRCSGRAGFTIVELVVVVVLLFLAIAWVVPIGTCRSRETANRVKCGSNLRQLGQALLLYSNENRNAFPRTRYVEGAPPKGFTRPAATQPFTDDGPEPNDVTAAMFLLLRTQDISPEVFVCPTSTEQRFDPGAPKAVLDYSNFTSPTQLSYSYANPYPSAEARATGYSLKNTLAPDFAVMADLNPGGEALLRLTPSSPQRAMVQGNSPNHDRDGQNVLFGDGHVEFANNPFVGIDRDNVYTFGSRRPDEKSPLVPASEGIEGPPAHRDDSVLLPIAAHAAAVEFAAGVTSSPVHTFVFVASMLAMAAVFYHANAKGSRPAPVTAAADPAATAPPASRTSGRSASGAPPPDPSRPSSS